MNIFDLAQRRKRRTPDADAPVLQTAAAVHEHPFSQLRSYLPLSHGEFALYAQLRESVPVIDAALDKIVRLLGTFEVEFENEELTRSVASFLSEVRSGGQSGGVQPFLSVYMNQLLTFGTAVGEIVLSGTGREIYSLVNVPLENVELAFADNMIDTVVCRPSVFGKGEPFERQELLLVSALNSEPGKLGGVSVLHGLPFVTDILLKIYNTIGVNWERVGNVRFAVTYKPNGDSDRAMSRARARVIADEWSKAMRDTQNVSDFVSVGDVSVKVIGADNQILDSEVPVREMLEQIVAKLSVPPFLLGLSWSTTERMSSQQADILTSELEYYRRLLDSVIGSVVKTWLRLHGFDAPFSIKWNNINLQDEVELARARLFNAQAASLEKGGV